MDAFIFYVSGLLSLVAAAMVVTRRNPVYSTVYLVIFFTFISLDFLILRVPFLAVIQVLVYGGAIMVLFLFVIMLLNLTPEELRETVPRSRKVLAGLLAAAVYMALSAAIRSSPTVTSAPPLTGPVADPTLAAAGETAAIGRSLFNRHALPFEFTSILILIAIIGAIYLTKKRRAPAAEGAGMTAPAPPSREPLRVPVLQATPREAP